ncbi:uncharacterized protein LOC134649238 [Cydia amplana]|uniref:uncharacterized protein LOC134649238 n=1 Tax=Cydia amplana TaxID=1869771 RepID=UPI002FE51457
MSIGPRRRTRVANSESVQPVGRSTRSGKRSSPFRSLCFNNCIIRREEGAAMSHSVTITRTTTTTNGGSALFVNTGYLRTLPGLLKLAELALGVACVGVIGYYHDTKGYVLQAPELFFFLMAVTFMIGTFCLLTACLVSLSTASLISKTIYEVIYHGLACILYLAASLTLLIEVNRHKNAYGYRSYYEPYLAASIMGLVLAALYLISTFLANRSYRGI